MKNLLLIIIKVGNAVINDCAQNVIYELGSFLLCYLYFITKFVINQILTPSKNTAIKFDSGAFMTLHYQEYTP